MGLVISGSVRNSIRNVYANLKTRGAKAGRHLIQWIHSR